MIKRLTGVLVLLIAAASLADAQTQRGELHGAIGGFVFRTTTDRATEDSDTYFNHNFRAGYFFRDQLRLDAILNLDNLSVDQDLGIDIGIGGRYFYLQSGQFVVGSGLDLIVGSGEGRSAFDEDLEEVTPMDLDIVIAEAQFWPMPGGAFTASLTYRMNNLAGGDFGTNDIGINLGMLIRLK